MELARANEKLARDMLGQITEAVQEIFAKIVEAIKNLKDMATELVQDVVNKVTESVKFIKEEIKEHIDAAIAAGKDVVNCIATSNDAVEQLAKNAINTAVKCVNDYIDNTINTLNNYYNEVMAMKDKIIELGVQLKNCGWSVSCIASTTKEILAYIANTLPRITKMTINIPTLITDVQPQCALCIARITKQVAEDGLAIVADVKKCVANL